MKERPILMTPENAQKVHDGVKTQTRRLNGLEEVNSSKLWDYPQMQESGVAVFLDSTQANPFNNALDVKCPYGKVGDRLWIREALHRRGDVMCYFDGIPVQQEGIVWPSHIEKSTIPSIHMPRWACRTVVEITEIRVERLQDISEEDARAEGCAPHAPSGRDGRVYRRPFECLWESINGKESWQQNPWVWVIGMKKIGQR